MQNYMSFLGFKVAIIGPCMNKNPSDKSDPNICNQPENKSKFSRKQSKIKIKRGGKNSFTYSLDISESY